MTEQNDRRHAWKRIIGVERRGAPIPTLEGNPLPDPTLLEDEDFWAARPEHMTVTQQAEDNDFRTLK